MKAGEPLLLLTRLKHITMRYVKKKNDQNYHKNSPVALPGVPYVRVCYGVFIRLLIQKVKHVLDGEGQGAASVRCAKDGLEQVVHKLLERALKTTTSEGHPNVLHASMFCWGLLWKPLVRGFSFRAVGTNSCVCCSSSCESAQLDVRKRHSFACRASRMWGCCPLRVTSV